MVAGNPQQTPIGGYHGGCQRHPDLGSDPGHSPRHCQIEEKQKLGRVGDSATTRSSSPPHELWIIHPDFAGDRICPRLIIMSYRARFRIEKQNQNSSLLWKMRAVSIIDLVQFAEFYG